MMGGTCLENGWRRRLPRRKSCKVGKSSGLRVRVCLIRAMLVYSVESYGSDTTKTEVGMRVCVRACVRTSLVVERRNVEIGADDEDACSINPKEDQSSKRRRLEE
jgi:hypothetical protein